MAKPIKLAQARLVEMRAQGLDPGHGGEAAKQRGAKLAASNRLRHLNLAPEDYKKRRAVQARERQKIRNPAQSTGLSLTRSTPPIDP